MTSNSFDSVGITSTAGFEIGIELVAKARRARLPVAELPTIWLERHQGVSNFKLVSWLPDYLRWWSFAFGPRLTADEIRAADRSERTSMSTVLVSGSAGFIGGYVVKELLDRGHDVVGIDNYSKYGPVRRSYDDHPRYRFIEGDARDVDLMTTELSGCDHFIAGAAMIGGISYFHTYAYDLLATNERITASSCDAAIKAHESGRLQKVTYLSSSMVFESADAWPSYEGQEHDVPPPVSSYGFQKLAVEYFARAAFDQYGLPYTIVRPFNCVGVGERRALGDVEILSGNVRLAMSHVVPDLVQKVLKGQDPAAHPGRRHPDPPLHLRCRPGRGNRDRHGAPGRTQRGLQSVDARVDHGSRAGRGHLGRHQGPRGALPLGLRPSVRARREPPGAGHRKGKEDPRIRSHHLAREDPAGCGPLDREGGRRRHHLILGCRRAPGCRRATSDVRHTGSAE